MSLRKLPRGRYIVSIPYQLSLHLPKFSYPFLETSSPLLNQIKAMFFDIAAFLGVKELLLRSRSSTVLPSFHHGIYHLYHLKLPNYRHYNVILIQIWCVRELYQMPTHPGFSGFQGSQGSPPEAQVSRAPAYTTQSHRLCWMSLSLSLPSAMCPH